MFLRRVQRRCVSAVSGDASRLSHRATDVTARRVRRRVQIATLRQETARVLLDDASGWTMRFTRVVGMWLEVVLQDRADVSQ